MSQVSIPRRLWFSNMLLAIDSFAQVGKGFAIYEDNRMYAMYSNYLDYAYMYLDDMSFYEFIEGDYALLHGVSPSLLNLLFAFREKVEAFFESSGELRDFEVIRRKEWDEIIPLAQECYKGLKELYDKMPPDEDTT